MSNNDNFLAKAQAATQRVVAASATVQQNPTPAQTIIVQELAQDRPTIHAAVTSFLSLVAARSLVASDSDKQEAPSTTTQQPQQRPLLALSNAEALQCSRALLKAMNDTMLCATLVSLDAAMDNGKAFQMEEYNLVAQLWNGLVASDQKPARFLGRRALRHAWADVRQHATLPAKPKKSAAAAAAAEMEENQDSNLCQFLQEFERLLFLAPPASADEDDNDAALIWDLDGGEKELQRRRDKRQQRATDNTHAGETKEEHEEEDKKLPFIEELPESEID